MSKTDCRNKLNDLTGKEWLKLTKSFWLSEKCIEDKIAMQHPAPFLLKDTMKLISMFTKKAMTVLDPFVGSGTALLASGKLARYGVGIDLNSGYKKLATKRLKEKGYIEKKDYLFIVGDAIKQVAKVNSVDYIITSPPYHNILKNNGQGLRAKKTSGYRNGARSGVEYYSDLRNDLGNQPSYIDFLELLQKIMKECHKKLSDKKYCSMILSDFTVNKKEICVQADIVNLMQEIGFEFTGTIVLLQNNKPLYPFGYPFAYKINHQHQNIINFRKI